MSKRNKKPALMLAALAVCMFGFAFALVPLYNVFCEITGLNGRASGQAALLEEIGNSAVSPDREVKIEFLTKVARGMPWEFRPAVSHLIVRPGEMHTATFFVRNLIRKTVAGQAVPSISPGQAALYVKKIECFCFEQQELQPDAEMEMSVSFFVDAELPAEISELTLSYTMFRVGNVEHEHINEQMARQQE